MSHPLLLLALLPLLSTPGLRDEPAPVPAGTPPRRAAPADSPPPNLLLLLADDLGVDRVAAYGEDPFAGPTPVLDGLAAQGVLFRNAWSNPVCSSSRATILTGRHGYRTGVTTSINYFAGGYELSLDETTLPEALPARYATGLFGKWHLANEATSGPLHPLLSGFDHAAGTIDSFSGADPDGVYYDFVKHVDGEPVSVTTYATTDTVDDALAWIGAQTGPWFCYVSFNTPHSPFHHPPPELITQELPAGTPTSHAPKSVRAAIEAMDTEIGRLLQSLPPGVLDDTTVVFVGDNGTAGAAVTLPHMKGAAKGTVLEGGVNVPLIVAGRGVTASGRECAGLVHTTDLFPTLLELAGAASAGDVDGVSLVPYLSAPEQPSIRSFVFTERRVPNGFGPYTSVALAARDQRYKLVYEDPPDLLEGSYRLFDLEQDPFEQDNLLKTLVHGPLDEPGQRALARLTAILERRMTAGG